MKRVFIASLSTETNAFAPFPTGRAAFEEQGISKTGSTEPASYEGAVLSLFRRRAEADGYEVAESITAFAQPGGKTVRSVYEELRDEILSDLKAAGPADMVLLLLHGAMVADGYDDCEADITRRVRALVPEAVIGVELDPHCHLSAELLEQADLVIAMKEYPHTDGPDRAEELYDLCRNVSEGLIRPVAALMDTRMIGFYPTFRPPMSDIVAGLRALEGEPTILSASIAHGFPWADVADVGTRVLVYADADAEAACSGAVRIAEHLYRERRRLLPDYPRIEEALARTDSLGGRIVLGDYSDNPGGGAPGDSTFFLRALLDRRASDAVIGCFHDPAVARIAADAGEGARIPVRLGGKCGPASGDPVDLEVTVMAVRPGYSQQCFDARVPMGLTVWLRHGGIDLVVNDVRSQVYSTDLFEGLGIELASKKLIVVKSSSHFEHSFDPIADHSFRVMSPGALSLDLDKIPYTKRDLGYFPRVDDPWATQGEPAPQVIG